jgi:thioester reductase-like protein
MNLFVTGATGFLGTALLARIGNDPTYEKIYVLIRGGKLGSAHARLKALLTGIFPPSNLGPLIEKFVAIEGDLTGDNLGLTATDHFMLQTSVNQIVHIGASTDFGAPLDESRRYNVAGTRRVMDLAILCKKAGVLKRFDYVSTAYVAGIKAGTVDENTTVRGQQFANNYERSKYEAEIMVRGCGDKLPITIYRPSIVVGDSRNGYTPHFKVLYWPLKLLSKRLLPLIPTNLRAQLDVVPVDFVADSIALLMKLEEANGKCFHLTAGINNEVQMETVLEDARKFAGIERVPVIPLWIFDVIRFGPFRYILSKDFWETCKLAAPYYYYLKGGGPRFNAESTHQLLKSHGISIKNWQDYREPVLSYCKTSGWGKKNRVPTPPNFFPSPGIMAGS